MSDQEIDRLVELFKAARTPNPKDTKKDDGQIRHFVGSLVHDESLDLVQAFRAARREDSSDQEIRAFLKPLLASMSSPEQFKELAKRIEELKVKLQGLDKVPDRVGELEKLVPALDTRLKALDERVNALDKKSNVIRLELDDVALVDSEFYSMLQTLLARNETVGVDSRFNPVAEFDLVKDRAPYVAFMTIAGLLRANNIESPYLRDPRLRDLATRLHKIGFIGAPGGVRAKEFTKSQLTQPVNLGGALRRPPVVFAGEDEKGNSELRTWLMQARSEAAAYGAKFDEPIGVRLVYADTLADVRRKDFEKAADDTKYRCAAGVQANGSATVSTGDGASAGAASLADGGSLHGPAGNGGGNGAGSSGASNGHGTAAAAGEPRAGLLYAISFDTAITDATREFAINRRLHEMTFLTQVGRADLMNPARN